MSFYKAEAVGNKKEKQVIVIEAVAQVIVALTMLYIMLKDWKEKIIPNWTVVLICICGIWINWQTLHVVITGIGIMFVFFFPFWAAKALGGGDLKLMMALGAFVGVYQGFLIFLLGAIPCLVFAVFQKLRQSKESLIKLLQSTTFALKMQMLGQLKLLSHSAQESIPLGTWIALGYFIQTFLVMCKGGFFY